MYERLEIIRCKNDRFTPLWLIKWSENFSDYLDVFVIRYIKSIK